jgi:hypothetical protein
MTASGIDGILREKADSMLSAYEKEALACRGYTFSLILATHPAWKSSTFLLIFFFPPLLSTPFLIL